MMCEQMIESFLYSEMPFNSVSKGARFEAISAEILGSKQRRFGPVQTPEVQVAVRDVIRLKQEENACLRIFVPMGSSKISDGNIDILEFMMLKQLQGLQESLRRMNVGTIFEFRVEDLTDRWLFGDYRIIDIEEYANSFRMLAKRMLTNTQVRLESEHAEWANFANLADQFTPIFEKYMLGYATVDTIREIGWKGDIPKEQVDHYLPVSRTIRYFAWTLARVKLGILLQPKDSIQVSFARPVPGAPTTGARVHYRTIPERFTSNHVPAWNAYGYMEIRGNMCIPKIVPKEGIDLESAKTEWNGVIIDTPYRIVE